MDINLEGLTPLQQAIAGVAFVATLGVLAAIRHWGGQRAGPAPDKVKEFYASGTLSDAAPFRELVAIAHEMLTQVTRIAETHERAIKTYDGHLAAMRADQELDEEADRRAEKRVKELLQEMGMQQGPPPRKPGGRRPPSSD